MSLNKKITDWTKQVVWISGASTGIGFALAEALLQRGAKVILSARDVTSLKLFCEKHPDALAMNCDICDVAALNASMQIIMEKFHRLDLFVANAGVYHAMHGGDIDAVKARQTLDINVQGTINSVAVVVPTLLRQGCGGIAVVASVAGYRGLPQALIYGASKAALINFTESLYLDLSADGVNVTLINPGFVDTRLTRSNDFEMPALMTSVQAAEKIIAGLERGAFEIHFPRRFTLWLKLLRMLPYRVYFFLIRRATR